MASRAKGSAPARLAEGRVTITDVAREAGVAISTVSAALNGRDGVSEQTRERVAGIAQRLGWVPSIRGRSLVSRQAWAVGLLIQRPVSVLESDPFFAGFIGGVETVLDAANYGLLLQVAADRDRVLQRVPQWALSEVVDGIFLTDVEAQDARFALVQQLGLPAVAINPGEWQPGVASSAPATPAGATRSAAAPAGAGPCPDRSRDRRTRVRPQRSARTGLARRTGRRRRRPDRAGAR